MEGVIVCCLSKSELLSLFCEIDVRRRNMRICEYAAVKQSIPSMDFKFSLPVGVPVVQYCMYNIMHRDQFTTFEKPVDMRQLCDLLFETCNSLCEVVLKRT